MTTKYKLESTTDYGVTATCRPSAPIAQHLRVYMNHVRKKLGEQAGQPRLLCNEPGIGYRLIW